MTVKKNLRLHEKRAEACHLFTRSENGFPTTTRTLSFDGGMIVEFADE